MFCKVIFGSKTRFAKSAKSFLVRKHVLQSLQSQFWPENTFCKVCKVIFRSKTRFAKSAKSSKTFFGVSQAEGAHLYLQNMLS